MAARRALEWIGVSKAQLVFRYEISDLFLSLFPSLSPLALYPGQEPITCPGPCEILQKGLVTLVMFPICAESADCVGLHSILTERNPIPRPSLFSVLQYALTGGGSHEKRDCVVSFIT